MLQLKLGKIYTSENPRRGKFIIRLKLLHPWESHRIFRILHSIIDFYTWKLIINIWNRVRDKLYEPLYFLYLRYPVCFPCDIFFLHFFHLVPYFTALKQAACLLSKLCRSESFNFSKNHLNVSQLPHCCTSWKITLHEKVRRTSNLLENGVHNTSRPQIVFILKHHIIQWPLWQRRPL